MMRRSSRGGRGLLGTAATTAVIVGTASATSNAMNNKQAAAQQANAQKAAAAQASAQQTADVEAMKAQLEQLQGQQVAATAAALPVQAASPDAQADLIEKLKQLGALKDAGVLSEDEFTAAKSKILFG